MYNVATVQDELISLCAWRKDSDPEATSNPMGDLLTGTSGISFSDQHPLLTMKNIASIAPVFSGYTYAAWSSLTTYSKGDIRTSGGNYYVSIVNGNLNNAVGSASYWRQTTPFNEWLRTKTAAGIIETINDWIGKKFEVKTAGNLLKRKQVLDIPGIEMEAVTSMERYGCWRVVPDPKLETVVTINRVSLHLSESETVNIELYKNGETTPSQTVSITGDSSADVRWAETNWELERGNVYYIAFDTDGLSSTPYNGIAQMDRSDWGYSLFPGTLPFAEVAAFTHAGPGESGWSDVSDILVNHNNYGLNIVMSARCDYTELIVDHKTLFATAIAKRVAINFLKELVFNPDSRINRNEDNIPHDTVMYEIDGNPQGRKSGIKSEYDSAINTITFDQKHLSKWCLPCRRTQIIIGSVYG